MGFKFTDNSGRVKAELEKKAEAVLEAVGIHIEGEAKEELENSPRRVDTGRLKNSITHQVAMGEKAVYIGTKIGTNVEYAIYVHEGTSRMAPNRFLKNACTRNEAQVRKFIENELKS